MKNPTTIAFALSALTLSAACGDSTPLMLEVGHPPRAVVSSQGVGELFTGEFVAPDFSDDEDVSTLREAYLVTAELRNGQRLTSYPSINDEVSSLGDPGVFKIGSAVELIGPEDVTLESITVSYPFSESPIEFEREVSKTLRTGGGRVAFDVEFLAGQGELDTFQRSLLTESETLGGSIITVPAVVTLEGTSSSGASVRSNALKYPITMCVNCADLITTPYALGSQR